MINDQVGKTRYISCWTRKTRELPCIWHTETSTECGLRTLIFRSETEAALIGNEDTNNDVKY